ncbi:hypothetical protein B0H10DRAFT_2027966 [Mycena sp. CBHHK59/15]|nr:hypothetical protein B0H10DRAFT_2027966 [Mycena sp. CBHHK59/15]
MFFVRPFVSTTLILLSTIHGIPQADALTARASCSLGYYPINNTACAICPPGNTCDGRTGPAPCGTGHAMPRNGSSGICDACPAGAFQNRTGQAACIPCDAGSYSPYPAASYCNKAPSGWFQGLPGQSFRCGTCCGWEALANGNTQATNCSNPLKPFAYPNSGSGCIAQPAGKPFCNQTASCVQFTNGSCPAATMNY